MLLILVIVKHFGGESLQ